MFHGLGKQFKPFPTKYLLSHLPPSFPSLPFCYLNHSLSLLIPFLSHIFEVLLQLLCNCLILILSMLITHCGSDAPEEHNCRPDLDDVKISVFKGGNNKFVFLFKKQIDKFLLYDPRLITSFSLPYPSLLQRASDRKEVICLCSQTGSKGKKCVNGLYQLSSEAKLLKQISIQQRF